MKRWACQPASAKRPAQNACCSSIGRRWIAGELCGTRPLDEVRLGLGRVVATAHDLPATGGEVGVPDTPVGGDPGHEPVRHVDPGAPVRVLTLWEQGAADAGALPVGTDQQIELSRRAVAEVRGHRALVLIETVDTDTETEVDGRTVRVVENLHEVAPHDLVLRRQRLPAPARRVRHDGGSRCALRIDERHARLVDELGFDLVQQPHGFHRVDPLTPEVDLRPVGTQLRETLGDDDIMTAPGQPERERLTGHSRAGDENAQGPGPTPGLITHDLASLSAIGSCSELPIGDRLSR